MMIFKKSLKIDNPRLLFLSAVFFYVFAHVILNNTASAFVLGGYRQFIALFQIFSGMRVPALTQGAVAANWLMMVVSPLLLVTGYLLGGLVVGFFQGRHDTGRRFGAPRSSTILVRFVFGTALYVMTLSIANWYLFSVVSLAEIGSWLDYGSMVELRYKAFAKIPFMGFVFLYSLVSFAGAYLVAIADRLHTRAVSWSVLALVSVTSSLTLLLLFQKKVLVSNLLVILAALAASKILKGVKKQRVVIMSCIGFTLLAVVYFSFVIIPTYSANSRTLDDIDTAQLDEYNRSAFETEEEYLDYLAVVESLKSQSSNESEIQDASFNFSSREQAVFLYTALSPLTRTSIPSLFVVNIFPKHHSFQGLDLGRPISGVGSKDTSPRLLWSYLNPNNSGGALPLPLQFSFYAQAGMPAALVGPLVVGLLVGLIAYFLLTAPWISNESKGLVFAVVVLFLIWLTIDSLRNSVVVSYGMIWPGLFTGVVVLSELILRRVEGPAFATDSRAVEQARELQKSQGYEVIKR